MIHLVRRLKLNSRQATYAAVAVASMALVIGTILVRASACTVSAKLVPSCGAWWGGYSGGNPQLTLDREAPLGRKYDIVLFYHDWNDTFPTAGEASLAEGGRFLKFNLENRNWADDNQNLCWSEISNGSQDTRLRQIAANLRTFGHKFFLTFLHEPENNAGSACNAPARIFGTAQEYIAAWRHIHALFTAEGVTNAVWTWTTMRDPVAAYQFYPGDDVVDWIAWDSYNWANCAGRTGDAWRTFDSLVRNYYDYTVTRLGKTKPLMLGEYGTHDNPALGDKLQWFRDVPAVIQAYPRLKAIIYFDRIDARDPSDPCNWMFDITPDVVPAYAEAGAHPYFNQPHR